MTLVPIVEGFAEVDAVPELLRRIIYGLEVWDLDVAKPFRVKRNLVVKEGELERAIAAAVADRTGASGVVVILDADDDCAAELGPRLVERARRATQLPVVLILAVKEYECWFLAAKRSLRGLRGIRDDAEPPVDPEAIRDGKGHLTANMIGDRGYIEVTHQAPFSAQMDFDDAAARSASFAKLRRDVEALVRVLRPAA